MTDFSSKSKMGAALVSALAPEARVGGGAGDNGTGGAHGPASATTPATGDVVLHRDGSKAVPFRAYPVASESSHRVALRRDGSKADPFVADLAPTGTPAADGFDWGDAALGLAAGMIVGVLGLAAIGGYGGRRAQTA